MQQTQGNGEARTAIELFRRRVAKSGRHIALRHKVGPTWQPITWAEWDTAAREIAGGLRALGVATGDRVCILANTRHEWVACDVGVLMAGGVTVPIYQSNTPDQCEYIISDCGAKVVVVEDPYQLEKLRHPEVSARLAGVTIVMISDTAHLEKPDARGRIHIELADLPAADREGVHLLEALRTSGRGWLAKHAGGLEQAWDEVTPDHIFTIVYTSGTTGPPKGVVLTHGAIAFECNAMHQGSVLQVDERDEQLMFLPLAHIFARILEWTGIAVGFRTAFAEGIPQLMANMKEIRPTFMGSVPRVYEKAYVKLQANFAEKRKKPVAKLLIDWALGVGQQVSRLQQDGRRPDGLLELQQKLADRLLFSKIKDTFGGRLRFFVSGGAPLSKEIAEFFHAAGILILEGYGLTETTAASTVNRPDRFRFGTVGTPVPGVEVKIAPDGEILIRGKSVLREYYGKPDATREAIDAEGWFHSGDIGVIEQGFVRITDRKKDIIVTAGGKNVAPQNIEGALKAQCPYVSQVMVHGDKRNFLSALITLNEEAVVAWAREKGIGGDVVELATNAEIKTLIARAVDTLNGTLPSFETIKKFAILPRDFTQESGELTPTLKVKRKFCSEKYRDVLDGFYA